MEQFDTVVVGSGFGGAVMACRLAEKGETVLVLERGRRWRPDEYPSVSHDHWFWDEDEPERQNGWLDFRWFGDMSVAMGAGVGGGSLIYANVSIEAPPATFDQGWPEAITHDALKPHYDEAGRMLAVGPMPERQLTPRTRLMREAAERLGHGDRFRVVDQALSYDPDWHADLPDAYSHDRSRRFINAQGVEQGTCVHCGNCDLGCPVLAKNTLDLNYLARAEQQGAVIRPLHQVRCVSPDGDGYRLHVRDLGEQQDRAFRAARVVLAAGSVGSTELLLRCRDQFRTLPRLSAALGERWSANGDFVTPAWYQDRAINPSRGPTISAAIDYLDGAVDGERFLVEDGGIPDLLAHLVEHLGRRDWRRSLIGRHRLARALRELAEGGGTLARVMPWFGQAVDGNSGRFYLGRRWYAPWRRDRLKLDWDYRPAESAVAALARSHERLTQATGGESMVPPTWSVLKNLVTPHPLGGCNMADDAARGVVDDRGEVYGYPGLYVMDGSVIPRALGLNPSRTIAALAEYAAARIA